MFGHVVDGIADLVGAGVVGAGVVGAGVVGAGVVGAGVVGAGVVGGRLLEVLGEAAAEAPVQEKAKTLSMVAKIAPKILLLYTHLKQRKCLRNSTSVTLTQALHQHLRKPQLQKALIP